MLRSDLDLLGIRASRKRSGTYRQVEATVLELAILLTQRTRLAAAMDAAVLARLVFEVVLTSQLGPVQARIHARATKHPQQQSVQ